MGVASSRARLQLLHQELLQRWSRVCESWDDPVRHALGTRQIEPLDSRVRSALSAMDKMRDTIARIRQECG
jgi:hypothetical protein